MKYSIFSVDNSRDHYVEKIKNTLGSWDLVVTDCVDGRIAENLAAAQKKYLYPIRYKALVGQLGIWYTVLNSLEHAPLVTFEDDAMLGNEFLANFGWRLAELPDDADFFSLFIPRDSDHLYTRDAAIGTFLCRTYQRYGGVSMFYTEKGAKNIKKLLERDGITGQYDDTLYHYSSVGELKGYCSKPSCPDLVYITGREESIVQETEEYRQ